MSDLKTTPRPLDELKQQIDQEAISKSARLVFDGDPLMSTKQNWIWASRTIQRSQQQFARLWLMAYRTDDGWEKPYLLGETDGGWVLIEDTIRDDTSA